MSKIEGGQSYEQARENLKRSEYDVGRILEGENQLFPTNGVIYEGESA